MKRESTLVLALLVASLTGPFTTAQETVDLPKAQKEAYHFFVGVDLRIPYENAFYPIERIWNARAHIKVDDDLVAERIRNIKDLKVDRKAKVSPQFVRIKNLECKPAYSPERDPQSVAIRSQAIVQSMADAASDEMDASLYSSVSPINMRASPYGNDASASPDGGNAEMERLQGVQEDFASMAAGNVSPTSTQPTWDMLQVSFSISSDEPHPSGHIVMIFQLTDTPDGEAKLSWFHFLFLDEITPEKKTYDYRLAAYPDGMYIVTQEAFLFVNGSEIATNLSPKHVAMSEDNARVFLKYRYLANNNGQTRPPDRAWKYLSPYLRDRVKPDLRTETIKLKIDPDGMVQDIAASRELKAALRPEGIKEIASMIYLPALENGQPVFGELILPLNEVILD